MHQSFSGPIVFGPAQMTLQINVWITFGCVSWRLTGTEPQKVASKSFSKLSLAPPHWTRLKQMARYSSLSWWFKAIQHMLKQNKHIWTGAKSSACNRLPYVAIDEIVDTWRCLYKLNKLDLGDYENREVPKAEHATPRHTFRCRCLNHMSGDPIRFKSWWSKLNKWNWFSDEPSDIIWLHMMQNWSADCQLEAKALVENDPRRSRPSWKHQAVSNATTMAFLRHS